MPNFSPTPPPQRAEDLKEYAHRELRRIGDNLRDDADKIHYRTIATTESLSAGVSANWKCSNSNVLRLSTSNTLTITGLAHKQAARERVIINIGTGVVVLKHQGTESSVSHRFALSEAAWQLSQNAAAIIWYDVFSSRHRGIART